MKRLNLITFAILLFALSGCNLETEPPVVLPEDDTESPIIEIIGDEEIFHVINRDYTDLGATISDNVDSSDSLNLVITGDTVNTRKLGTYTIKYDALDSSGNIANPVARIVHVVNREPGMTVSFSYESYDRVGMFIQVYDINDILVGLEAFLYLDGEEVKSMIITSDTASFEFSDLEVSTDYDFFVEGTYELGGDLELQPFSTTPIKVGTYRRLDDALIDDYPSDELFYAIQDLIYLPYNKSEDVILERIAFELTKVEPELVIGVSTWTYDSIILTDGTITSVYDYFFLKGIDARGTGGTYDNVSGVCCGPMVVRYGSGRIPEQIILHEFGHSVDLMLLFGISYSLEWLEIWEAEKYLLFPTKDYYLDYPEEYFAESFAYYYQGEITRSELLEKAPLTYAIMESLVERYNEIYEVY